MSAECWRFLEGDAVLPVDFLIPKWLQQAGWKVKIREKEIREPPHVTIIRGTDSWRIDLRTGLFMERIPDPAEIPQELLNCI